MVEGPVMKYNFIHFVTLIGGVLMMGHVVEGPVMKYIHFVNINEGPCGRGASHFFTSLTLIGGVLISPSSNVTRI